MSYHKVKFPIYWQRNWQGDLVQVIPQRHYEKITWEKVEIGDDGLSRGFVESSKKMPGQ